jgi:tetratricopeptide (TPR) repeat protein
MPKSKAHEHIRESAAALDAADFEKAQVEAERAIAADQGLADAYTLHGIALARQGKEESATGAFRKAFMLQPLTPRHGYNLGAHLFAQAQYWDARKAISEALKDDPDFAPAKDLLARIDEQRYGGEVEFVVPEIRSAQVEMALEGEPHVLSFMSGMEKPWTSLGWIFVAIAAVAAICFVGYRPIPLDFKQPLKTDIASIVTVFLLVVSGISSIMWMLIDVVDRKLKLLWLVPTIVCCTAGFHAVPHALYMLMRKT